MAGRRDPECGSTHSLAMPHEFFVSCCCPRVTVAERCKAPGASVDRLCEISSARSGWSSRLQLFLLSRDPKDKRRDSHYCAVHGARVGTGLHGGEASRAPYCNEAVFGAPRGCRDCAGHWLVRAEQPPVRPSRSGSGAGCRIFIQLLQRGRTSASAAIRPLDGTSLHHPCRLGFLDCRESTEQNYRSALSRTHVAVPGGILISLRAPSVHTVLCRP